MTEAEQLLANLRLPRPDRSPIYEWARKHLVLPESYATPGPFNVRLSPWLIPIFDALQNPLVRRVHFRKAVQIGGTLVADIWHGLGMVAHMFARRPFRPEQLSQGLQTEEP